MQQTIKRFSVGDGKEGSLIELKDLVQVIRLFGFICSKYDLDELRWWIFNQCLIAQTPQFFRQETILVDAAKLMQKLISEAQKGESPHVGMKGEKSLPLVYNDVVDHILTSKIEGAI